MAKSQLTMNEIVAREARWHAKNAESAGDFVGANDMALANRCYQLAGSLKAYAGKVEAR